MVLSIGSGVPGTAPDDRKRFGNGHPIETGKPVGRRDRHRSILEVGRKVFGKVGLVVVCLPTEEQQGVSSDSSAADPESEGPTVDLENHLSIADVGVAVDPELIRCRRREGGRVDRGTGLRCSEVTQRRGGLRVNRALALSGLL